MLLVLKLQFILFIKLAVYFSECMGGVISKGQYCFANCFGSCQFVVWHMLQTIGVV